MPSSFPGMDPYLEDHRRWQSLHFEIIYNIVQDLQPQLVPRYLATPEQRVLLAPLDNPLIPDMAVTDVTAPEIIEAPELTHPHRFVAIRDLKTHEFVTAIEVLRPRNKTGRGLEEYREKQSGALVGDANLVEIDLLRRGYHVVAVPAARLEPSDYCVSVHRARSTQFEVIRFGVRDPLPNVAIPLRRGEQDAVLHLGEVLRRCYDVGAFVYRIDYSQDPDPPLTANNAAWARELLAERQPSS